jgi:uncharacterized membrane protein
MDDTVAPSPATPRRYGRDTTEFGRVVNLSDGIFAIALTLLVLDLMVPDVPGDELGAAWRDLVPSLIAFALAFGLVANIWWLHHKVFAALASVEPGMIAINVVGLAGVALVPFPTNLLGNHPSEQAAALPFIGLFAILSAVWLLFVLRAHQVGAWRRPLDAATFRWLLLDWGATIATLLVALLVAVLHPLGALVLVTVGSLVVTISSGRFGPERTGWF